MTGETKLTTLLENAAPVLNQGEYVYCTLAWPDAALLAQAVVIVKEKEGVTLVLARSIADHYALEYDYIAAWITLEIHSSLTATGLTAAFSRALAARDISCNVVAGYYHDHIFVAHEDTALAMKILSTLGQSD